MRTKSLLLTLALGIVGSSSVALADHDDYQARRFDRERFDERYDTRYREPAYRRTTWFPLTTSQRLDRGGDLFEWPASVRRGQPHARGESGDDQHRPRR